MNKNGDSYKKDGDSVNWKANPCQESTHAH